MPVVRPWYVIPALGLASIGVAIAVTRDPWLAVALGSCGAALAAAIRAFLGPSGVAAIAAAGGAALGVLGSIVLAPHEPVRAAIAGAAGLFAIGELVRPKQPHESTLPAVGAALLAGVLDPSYIALVAVAAVAWYRAPVARARAAVIAPALGVLATALAIIAAFSEQGAHGHALVHLWHTWLGHGVPSHAGWLLTLLRTGDLVGPLTAFAALVGLALCLGHGRLAAAAVLAIVGSTAIASLTGGFVAPAAPLVAALAAGVAIGQLAALVHAPIGQTFVGATVGFVLVVVPAWTLIAPVV